jgi:hypothetical protein
MEIGLWFGRREKNVTGKSGLAGVRGVNGAESMACALAGGPKIWM